MCNRVGREQRSDGMLSSAVVLSSAVMLNSAARRARWDGRDSERADDTVAVGAAPAW